VVCLLFATLRKTLLPISDPDTWWHLRLGQEFQDSWSLAGPGQLSPFATRPWFATQWMPEVLASKFEQSFGLPGVAWLFGLGVVLLVFAVFLICRREADSLISAWVTGMCFLGTAMSVSPRPQMVSFLLLVVTTSAWVRTIRDLRPRWWLVPVTWLWACSHGMWFTGVIVGVATVFGLALDRRLEHRTAVRLAAVPLLSIAAAAVTPVGPKLLLAPLATSGMAPFVSEWAPPSFMSFGPAIAMAMVLATVTMWARHGNVPWSHIALVVVATGWILMSARTVALGALMMAPLLASTMQKSLPDRGPTRATRSEVGALIASGAAYLACLAVLVPSTAASPADVPNGLNPVLDDIHPRTVVLNAYELGGWLTWRHPDLAPVVDGMTDAYTTDYVAAFVSADAAEPGWQSFVKRSGAEYALLDVRSPLAAALSGRLHWERLNADEGYVMLKAPQG
jgi:hypothetical protein